MDRLKPFIKAVMLSFLVSLIAHADPNFDQTAPPSFADTLKLSRSKDHKDKGWLPELTGLPDKYQVAVLAARMIEIMNQEADPLCNAINLHLRMIVFQHFLIYQHMLNIQHIYFEEKTAYQWAHILAMILKESSGDSTNITDMQGATISTNDTKTNLEQWKKILALTANSRIQLTEQTNFGLTQLSPDRLLDAFHLAKSQRYNTAFLEGKEGLSTPGKKKLNTAIAIRRIIWFYQGFAQGRIAQSEDRIPQQDIDNPEFSERYNTGISLAILYCGTRFLFRGEYFEENENENSELKNAMASIAYCKLGNSQTGYGVSEMDERCFAEWVTLCPALNIDIATLTPLSYFQTRGANPICESTFKRLIKPKP